MKVITALGIAALSAVAVGAFLYDQNNHLTVTEYTLEGNFGKEWDGFKILHLSDLHGKSFGKNQKRLLAATEKISPDIIVFTGDSIHAHKREMFAESRRKRGQGMDVTKLLKVEFENKSEKFKRIYEEQIKDVCNYVSEASKKRNVYIVAGNHERMSGAYTQFKKAVLAAGATVLEDSEVVLERGGKRISLLGHFDLAQECSTLKKDDRISAFFGMLDEKLENLKKCCSTDYSLLLSHRPEFYDYYEKYGFDAVLCGHAHGGQLRLPFIGGVVAPNQGYFPKYTSGLHKFGKTQMIISRGLGNSSFPQRMFNRPELVVITLKST